MLLTRKLLSYHLTMSKISVICECCKFYMEKSNPRKSSCLSRKKRECNCAAISVCCFCCEKDKETERDRDREKERKDTKCKVIVDIDALRSRIAKIGRAQLCVYTTRLLFQISDNHYLPDAMVRDPLILVPNTQFQQSLIRQLFNIIAVIANNNRYNLLTFIYFLF